MAEINENISHVSDNSSTAQIKHAQISNVSDKKNASNEDALKRLQENNKHEKDMVKYGWFGKVFGAEENSSKALTFTIIVIILFIWAAICVLAIFYPVVKQTFIDSFKILTPIITLTFGYLFGKK